MASLRDAAPPSLLLPGTPHKGGRGLLLLLKTLATVHVVWFYLTRVACYIDLPAYEQGRAPNPAQSRLLLMAPLRWAHTSARLIAVADWLTTQRAWFPRGVRPEGLMEAGIDLLAVAIAGLVAKALYKRASPTGLLAPYLYPLSLLMVLSTYALLTFHGYRFTSDLPSMALFSLGLYLIYVRAHGAWFAAVFVLGTMNRETTLVLLLFFVLAECARGARFDWRRCYAPRTLVWVVPLTAAWAGWRLWVGHLFAGNPSMSEPRLGLNLGILAVPLAWPQLLSAFCYLLPLVLLYRARIRDRVLRAWLWGLPAWFALMLYYGVIVEIRIFGELIPYVACVAALIAEEGMLHFLALPAIRPAA